MRPLMYGYLCVDLVADRVNEWEERIRLFADREGFDLGMVFHERGGSRGAFTTLIHELRRAEARHVVVPSMAHVWGRGQARHALVARLWDEAGAGVWVADPQGNRIAVNATERSERGDQVSERSLRSDVARAAAGCASTGPTREIRVAVSPSSATEARLQVRCALSGWQLVELQAPVERIVADLVADAVDASTGAGSPSAAEDKPIVVRLRREGNLVLEVWDSRPRESCCEPDTPVNERIAALAARHGRSCPDAGGNLTWCELPIKRS